MKKFLTILLVLAICTFTVLGVYSPNNFQVSTEDEFSQDHSIQYYSGGGGGGPWPPPIDG